MTQLQDHHGRRIRITFAAVTGLVAAVTGLVAGATRAIASWLLNRLTTGC